MQTPMSVSTSLFPNQQALALVRELGDDKLLEVVSSQLEALSVEGESLVIRQQREQIVQRVVNAAAIVRRNRLLQAEMIRTTQQANQLRAKTHELTRQDQLLLQQEQSVHEETIKGKLDSVHRTHDATVTILHSCIDDTQQRVANTSANLAKTEQELQDKLEHEQALIAHSQSLAKTLGY